MKYKSWKRMAIELSAAQSTNLIYCERIENLRERIEKLRQQNADLRAQLPKVVSLDATGKLDANMMPTGVKPFGVIDSMARTVDHEQKCQGCEKCAEMNRRRLEEYSPFPRGGEEHWQARLAHAHGLGHPNMSNWRPVSKFDTYREKGRSL